MHKFLVKQAVVVPITAMLIPILWAFMLPVEYSSIAQHGSELVLLDHPIAIVLRIAAVVTGISMFLFGVGVSASKPFGITFTVVAAALAGASMISNGVFLTGSPLHGLYGIGFFIALVPACFAAEFCTVKEAQTVRNGSLAAALFILSYFLLNNSPFDPPGFKGITQRIAMLVIYGWYTYASLAYLRLLKINLTR